MCFGNAGDQGDFKIKLFDTFGFKALAGTRELADTLLSRCIITTMSQAVRHVNIFLDETRAQELRNKLLRYRYCNLGTADINGLMETFTQENKDFRNGRIIELFLSLLSVAPNKEIKQKLIAFMRQITQSDIEAEQTSIEAKVLEAIFKCEPQIDGGKITTQAITNAFNEDLIDDEKKNSRFIGRLVVSLGFAKCSVGNKNLAGFKYDKTRIERLQARYTPYALPKTLRTLATLAVPESMEKTSLIGCFDADFASVASVSNVSPQVSTLSQQEEVFTTYEPLICVFCQERIMADNWEQDDFTWNKPAHKECYDEKQTQLALQDTREEPP